MSFILCTCSMIYIACFIPQSLCQHLFNSNITIQSGNPVTHRLDILCDDSFWTKTLIIDVLGSTLEDDLIIAFGTNTSYFALAIAYDGRIVMNEISHAAWIAPFPGNELYQTSSLNDTYTMNNQNEEWPWRTALIPSGNQNEWYGFGVRRTDMASNIKPLILTIIGDRSNQQTQVTISKGSATNTFTYSSTWAIGDTAYLYMGVDRSVEAFTLRGITVIDSCDSLMCYDYNISHNSFGGVDNPSDIELNTEDILIITNQTDVVVYNASHTDIYFEDETIYCNQSQSNIHACFIACYSRFDCHNTNIIPAKDIPFTQLQLVCQNKYSCNRVTLNITNEMHMDTVTVLCISKLSCVELTINVTTSYYTKLTLHCHASSACSDTSVIIGNTVIAKVLCYDAHACDSMNIYTDHSDQIDLHVILYRYSSNIFIDYEWFTADGNVLCGAEDDHRFIQYPTTNLLNDVQFLNRAQEEYESNRLPCSSIDVQCGTNRMCTMQYTPKQIDLQKVLQDKDDITCYWLDLNHFLSVECHGNCDANTPHYVYNISLDVELYFDVDDEETLQHICDQYFSTSNTTLATLNNMDVIFAYTLHIMAASTDLSVVRQPVSELTESIACLDSQNDINMISMRTVFTVESNISKESDVTEWFDDNTDLFEGESQNLTSKWFGVPVIYEVRVVSSPGDKMIILSLAGVMVILAVVLVVGGCILNGRLEEYKTAEEQKAIRVSNPMVLVYTIGKYDEFIDDDDIVNVGAGVPDLTPGLSHDLLNITRFCESFGYELRTEERYEWKEERLIDDLKHQANHLANNIDKGKKYDALLVFVSCHGNKYGILSSDYQLIERPVIHRAFSVQYSKARSIPRVFLFDCCSGNEQQEFDLCSETEANPLNPSGVQYKAKSVDIVINHTVSAITPLDVRGQSWLSDQDNPDYCLVQIDAANVGFRSKLNDKKGSFLITKFVDKLLKNKQFPFLYKIVDSIEKELHDDGQQQIVPTYLSGTRYVRFIPNGSSTLSVHQGHKRKASIGSYSETKENDDLYGNIVAKGAPFPRRTKRQRRVELPRISNVSKQFIGAIGKECYYGEFVRIDSIDRKKLRKRMENTTIQHEETRLRLNQIHKLHQ